MVGVLTPSLRNYIIKRDKILSNVKNLEKEEKNQLMNRCWQYDCRLRKRLGSLQKFINRLNSDLCLLERWASEECHYDLIMDAVKHVPEITHLIKTSHKSRKIPYSKLYYTTHLVKQPDGTEIMQETFSDGKTKLFGNRGIISNPDSIFQQLSPLRAWVEKQIEQKNFDELKSFADYIVNRLKEEREENGKSD